MYARVGAVRIGLSGQEGAATNLVPVKALEMCRSEVGKASHHLIHSVHSTADHRPHTPASSVTSLD